ncbi:hypothetical protein LTR97_006802 [Elasticomyces elasticus]|uniref:Uncharacterized protein n=1 Tax=Elasticomyces elasticus TaxID=574655 RepID=A0AAN8A095_9PEZI|nr:hypothetical protein LTR97_006802 [Elasticomyces elasticus]
MLLLPPELRTDIYQLVLRGGCVEPVDLFAAISPGLSLSLTCRQVCLEARGLCRDAYPYTRYWSETHFVLHGVDAKESKPHTRHIPCPAETKIVHFTPQNLAQIRHLRFLTRARDLLVYDPRADIIARCSAKISELHSLDAMLSLERHAEGREWWCTEVDGVAQGPKASRLAVYVAAGNDVAMPDNPIRGGYCTVLFYDYSRSHWWADSGKERFNEVTVGEIEELMGVKLGVVGRETREVVSSQESEDWRALSWGVKVQRLCWKIGDVRAWSICLLCAPAPTARLKDNLTGIKVRISDSLPKLIGKFARAIEDFKLQYVTGENGIAEPSAIRTREPPKLAHN